MNKNVYVVCGHCEHYDDYHYEDGATWIEGVYSSLELANARINTLYEIISIANKEISMGDDLPDFVKSVDVERFVKAHPNGDENIVYYYGDTNGYYVDVVKFVE